MAEFSPDRVGLYEIVDVGGRPTAVFETFAIPARDRADAERRGNLAVARGRMQDREVGDARRQRLLDFSKAREEAARQAEARAKGVKP